MKEKAAFVGELGLCWDTSQAQDIWSGSMMSATSVWMRSGWNWSKRDRTDNDSRLAIWQEKYRRQIEQRALINDAC